MLRFARVLRRTSRKGLGGWTQPIRVSPFFPPTGSYQSSPLSSQGAQQMTNSPAGGSAARSSRRPPSAEVGTYTNRYSSVFHEDGRVGGKGPAMSADSRLRNELDTTAAARASGEAAYSWRANPLFGRPPTFTKEAGFASNAGTDASTARTNYYEEGVKGQRAWTGGEAAGGTFGGVNSGPDVDQYSLVDGKPTTLTGLIRLLVDASYRPGNSDSRAMGGDNSTKRAEQKEELKNLDPRIAPFEHEDVLRDCLRSIGQLYSPSGKPCGRDILDGRLVGLLFFSDTPRSLSFMQTLRVFLRENSPDFVVVAISMGGKEMMDVSRAHGFFHCCHRHGAGWVVRDTGLQLGVFSRTPKLFIVDGVSGVMLSHGGVTSVVANPDTCMSAWRRGELGFKPMDYFRALIL